MIKLLGYTSIYTLYGDRTTTLGITTLGTTILGTTTPGVTTQWDIWPVGQLPLYQQARNPTFTKLTTKLFYSKIKRIEI